MLTPIPLLFSLFIGLISLTLPAVGLVLLYKATRPAKRRVRVLQSDRVPQDTAKDRVPPELTTKYRTVTWTERWREPAVLLPLIMGAILLFLPFGGRQLVELVFPAGNDEPRELRGTLRDVTRSDGTKIHVEVFGPAGAPTLVLTHGWSATNTEWYYAKRQLSERFRLIVWDLPGLGETAAPQNGNFALEQMASDLHTVLSVADGRPVALVGHSIGGMINLTFCRLYPDLLGSQIKAIVQVDTSYTNPVRTTKNSSFSLALQKPVAEPILHAMVPLSPLVRAMNWLSYREGFAYLSNAQSAFAGAETRGQLDLVSRYQYESSPAVVAKGTLAMFHWDASPVLPNVNVPVLIVVGREDSTTLPSASEYMHDTMPNSALQIVSPGAHYSLLEQNEKVDSAIAQFAFDRLK